MGLERNALERVPIFHVWIRGHKFRPCASISDSNTQRRQHRTMARIALLAALTVVPPAWLQTTDALPQPPGAARASQLLRGAAAARQLQSAGVAGAHAAAQTSRQLLLRGAAATRQLQSAGVADLLSRDRATIYAGEGQHDLSPSPSAAAQLHSGSLYQQETSANVVKLATFDGAPTESDPAPRTPYLAGHHGVRPRRVLHPTRPDRLYARASGGLRDRAPCLQWNSGRRGWRATSPSNGFGLDRWLDVTTAH